MSPMSMAPPPSPSTAWPCAATGGEAQVYRFSCDAHWETVQDAVYASEDEARGQLPAQYRAVAATWNLA